MSGPFGDYLSNTGSGADPSEQHFTGKDRDTESGNDYFGARYYGSSMGRFMSPDFSGDGGTDPEPVPWADYTDPQSLNLYAYVGNNPLTNTDPDGHDCVVQSSTSSTTESVSTTSGNCDNVSIGDGQTKTYVPGTVTSITANGGNSIDIGYNSYDGQSSGVTNAGAAPQPDFPGLAYNYGNNAQGYQQLGAANRLVTNATIAVAGTYAAAGAGIVGGELLASQSPKIIIRAQQLAHALRVGAGHNTPLGTATEIKAAIQAALRAGQYTVGAGGVVKGTAIIQGVVHEFTGFLQGNQVIFSNIYRQ